MSVAHWANSNDNTGDDEEEEKTAATAHKTCINYILVCVQLSSVTWYT